MCVGKTTARLALVRVKIQEVNATENGDKLEEVIVGYTIPSLRSSTSSLSWGCSEPQDPTMFERSPGLTL